MPLSKIPNSMQAALTRAELPAGSVIQIQTGGSMGWTNTTSTSMVDALTCSITPTSTTSKIFVMMSLNGGTVAMTTQWGILQLYRDSTLIRRISDIYGYAINHNNYNTDITSNYLDDGVSTTSQVTYKLKFATSNSLYYVGFNNYGGANNRTSSTITLMEIAG
tara:strand:- start:9 stop:497 length:489 start_codon:yes stop_codon:yes gene_type:complete